MSHWSSIVGLAFSALFSVEPPMEAHACGGEWFPILEIDPRIRGVAQAEKDLDAGRSAQAGASVVRMIPHIKALNGTKSAIVGRAERVLSLALARGDGALARPAEIPREVQGTWLGGTAEARSANLAWAARVLERQLERRSDDPALITDLAETLARIDAERPRARRMLEELAARDLVATAEGYRALAELRAQAGDEHGRVAALERCRALAGKASPTSCQNHARG